jgi:hypothetical protein
MIVRVIGKYKNYPLGEELGITRNVARILIDKGLVEDVNAPKKIVKVIKEQPKKKTKKSKK